MTDLTGVIHEIADTIQREANVRAVFGEAIDLGAKRIVPIASVTIELGGGGGTGRGPVVGPVGKEDAPKGGAMGVGGRILVTPVGFLHEEDGHVVYTPLGAPAAEGAKGAGVAERILEALRRR